MTKTVLRLGSSAFVSKDSRRKRQAFPLNRHRENDLYGVS